MIWPGSMPWPPKIFTPSRFDWNRGRCETSACFLVCHVLLLPAGYAIESMRSS